MEEIVKDAYGWLARMYQEGDQVYLFGRLTAYSFVIVLAADHCGLYCLYQRQLSGNLDPHPDDPVPTTTTTKAAALPSIFADPGWNLLGTSILSTSNCGNPALRLFGIGPVAADGYGIGYIIKENGISM